MSLTGPDPGNGSREEDMAEHRALTDQDRVPHAGTDPIEISATADPRWQQLLETQPGDVFHSPGWLRVLERSYELPVVARLLVDDAGHPTAGFVYTPIDDFMDPRLVSLPFSDFCDPLVSNLAEWKALSDDLFDAGHRLHMRSLHSEVPLADQRLTVTDRARWHAIDLDRESDEVWDGIASSARRSIRKARKEGVEVRRAESLDDVRRFFELHLRVRKHKYGLLAQPWRFFEHIWDELLQSGDGALLMAVKDGELLGGVLFLEWNDTLYYKFNASDAERLGVRPNDLVIWEGIEHALGRGLRRFDFGLSDWDQEGLLRYKRKYATEEKTIHMLRHLPGDAVSDREVRARQLFPQLTELLVADDVGDDVTERGGDLLYRYFT